MADKLEAQISGIKSTLAQLDRQSDVTEDMRQLKKDLLELLEISEQQLLEMKKSALLSAVQSLEEKHIDSHVSSVGSQLNESLIGQRTSVPHRSANGVLHRQNAIICGVDADRGKVRVLLSAPTRPCDLPCPRFLAGEDSDDEDEAGGCGQNGMSCRKSHGLSVAVEELGEFREPDLAKLRTRQACLVKLPEKSIWLHARVSQIDALEDQCVVDLRNASDANGERSCVVKWENLIPLEEDEEEEEDEDFQISSGEDEREEEEEEPSVAPRSLAEAPAWERHSTGFASRMMAAMGYEPGRGLGVRGEGRLDPVPIEVLPAGASLDQVMKLRERRKAREERKAAGASSNNQKGARKDVFSFLNRTLSSSSTSSSRESNYARNKRLSNSSLASLGAQLLEAEKEVRAGELRLTRLNTALTMAGSAPAAAKLKRDKAAALSKLEHARELVKSLERHKEQRQERKKLTVF